MGWTLDSFIGVVTSQFCAHRWILHIAFIKSVLILILLALISEFPRGTALQESTNVTCTQFVRYVNPLLFLLGNSQS
jgi:hypothetical protein